MASFLQFPITSGYMDEFYMDSGGRNKGLDFGTPYGTPIEAVVGGKVVAVGDQGDGWGYSVKIRDANGLTHNYGHLSDWAVKPGDVVDADTFIGLSGGRPGTPGAGTSSGEHTSWDIFDDEGNFHDPTPFVGGNNTSGSGQSGVAAMGWEQDANGNLIYKPDGGGSSGPTTRNFPDGSLRALKPGADGTKPGDWQVVGAASPTAQKVPDLIYDAQGRAYRWTSINGMPVTARVETFDDPTKSATFVAPITPYQNATLGLQGGQLNLAYQQASDARNQAAQSYGLAVRNQNFTEAKYWQDRMDALDARKQDIEVQLKRDAEQRGFQTGERVAGQEFTAGENAADRALTTTENAANRAQQQKTLDETMRNNRVAAEQADKNLAFLHDKFTVETEMGRAKEARETQAQLWNQQRDIDQINYQYDQMAVQAQEFNAQESRAVSVENQRRLEAAAERRRQLAESIGTTAQDAGSRGKLAATLLANPGLGQLDSALAGGDDFFTAESLVPLTDLLGQREEAAKSPNFLAFNPISAPARPNIPVPTLNPPQYSAIPPRPQPTEYPTPGVATKQQQTDWTATLAAGGVPAWAQTPIGAPNIPNAGAPPREVAAQTPTTNFLTAADTAKWAHDNGISGFAEGGIAEGAYLGDEQGAELHVPLGPGQALVIPHDQVKNFLRDASARPKAKAKTVPVPKLARAEGVPAMADGGLFSDGSIFGNATFKDQEGTRNFLAEALKRALSGTPWEGSGRAPTPVELSAPGTDPMVQDLGGSLSALGTGTPSDLFLRRARLLTPQGITQSAGGARRSA